MPPRGGGIRRQLRRAAARGDPRQPGEDQADDPAIEGEDDDAQDPGVAGGSAEGDSGHDGRGEGRSRRGALEALAEPVEHRLAPTAAGAGEPLLDRLLAHAEEVRHLPHRAAFTVVEGHNLARLAGELVEGRREQPFLLLGQQALAGARTGVGGGREEVVGLGVGQGRILDLILALPSEVRRSITAPSLTK